MTRLEISGDYTSDWPEISLATRAEAGWRCVRCQHPFSYVGQPLPCDDRCDVTRGRLSTIAGGVPELVRRHGFDLPGLNFGVHHLDGNKANNAWWNRLALCNSCHLSIQARVIPERPYMLPHSPWFIPYVCGYFAHKAGLEISRAEAESDPRRYLALGQPWLYEATA